MTLPLALTLTLNQEHLRLMYSSGGMRMRCPPPVHAVACPLPYTGVYNILTDSSKCITCITYSITCTTYSPTQATIMIVVILPPPLHCPALPCTTLHYPALHCPRPALPTLLRVRYRALVHGKLDAPTAKATNDSEPNGADGSTRQGLGSVPIPP